MITHPLASLSAAAAVETGWLADLETAINNFFEPIATWATKIVFWSPKIGSVEFPFVVAWLIAAAVACTVYFGFMQFRAFNVALDTIRGKYSRKDDPGEITHFQALTSALSGTVGLGNIAGVGVALAIGGAGATFWMVLAGLLGMATKFAECTLGVKYREVNPDGTVSGGPFKYLPVAFAKLGKFGAGGLTGIYAVAILLFGMAGGNMFQSNQTVAQLANVTGGDASFFAGNTGQFVFGIILATLVALVIMGGMKSIGKVTGKLIPAMAAIYVTACLFVIGVNITAVPSAIGEIFTGAFSADGVTGGVLGVMIVGFTRAAFSNEAGLGSAPIAHSAVKTRRPASEGFVAMFEPFIDTVVICTMTALAIVIAKPASFVAGFEQVQQGGDRPNGVTLTSDAFATVLPWFPTVLAVAVALFAFSTLITWSYYGQQAWFKLFGRSGISDRIYKTTFCTFTVIGSVLSFGKVIELTDAALFVCGFINLAAVYILFPVIKQEMTDYLRDRKDGTLIDLRDNGHPTPSGSSGAQAKPDGTIDLPDAEGSTDLREHDNRTDFTNN